MKYQKKFIKLCEAEMEKYTAPQTGYYVQFVGDILEDKWIKEVAPAQMVENIKALMELKCRLRITEIDQIENVDAEKGYTDYPGKMATIVGELATGRYYNDLTVQIPINLVKVVDEIYPNLAPIPDHWKHESRINIKPVPLDSEEEEDVSNLPHRQTKTSDHGDGQDSPSDVEIAKESVDSTMQKYLEFLAE